MALGPVARVLEVDETAPECEQHPRHAPPIRDPVPDALRAGQVVFTANTALQLLQRLFAVASRLFQFLFGDSHLFPQLLKFFAGIRYLLLILLYLFLKLHDFLPGFGNLRIELFPGLFRGTLITTDQNKKRRSQDKNSSPDHNRCSFLKIIFLYL